MENVYKLSVKTCILDKIRRSFKLNQRSYDKKQQVAWGKGVQHEGKHPWSDYLKSSYQDRRDYSTERLNILNAFTFHTKHKSPTRVHTGTCRSTDTK